MSSHLLPRQRGHVQGSVWAQHGFVVEKINRQALKVDEKRTSTKGATFHMNVRPKDGKLGACPSWSLWRHGSTNDVMR